MREINPAVIWDLREGAPEERVTTDVEGLKSIVSRSALRSLYSYREELLKERKRQAEIKKKYGMESLRYLINRLKDELLEIKKRKQKE